MVFAAILAGIMMPVTSAGAAASKPVGRALKQDEPFTMDTAFTTPTEDFPAEASGCTTVMAGCTGTFVMISHDIAGEVTVIDDCTFRVTGWDFDGVGPAVEWWAAPQSGDPGTFPYDEGFAIKVGELGTGQEGDPRYVAGPSVEGGSDDITVRLGTGADGEPYLLSPDLDHISVWCEAFTIDFGSAALSCPLATTTGAPTATAPAPAPATDAPATPATPATGDVTPLAEVSGAPSSEPAAAAEAPAPEVAIGNADPGIATEAVTESGDDAAGGTDANSDTSDAADANSDAAGADDSSSAGLIAASAALVVAALVVAVV